MYKIAHNRHHICRCYETEGQLCKFCEVKNAAKKAGHVVGSRNAASARRNGAKNWGRWKSQHIRKFVELAEKLTGHEIALENIMKELQREDIDKLECTRLARYLEQMTTYENTIKNMRMRIHRRLHQLDYWNRAGL